MVGHLEQIGMQQIRDGPRPLPPVNFSTRL